MKISNAVIEDYDKLILDAERMNHKTGIKFLQEINGWRNGCGHLFVGMPSGGKSTLFRSLLSDFSEFLGPEARVYIHLSEESINDFKTSIAYMGGFKNADRIFFGSEIADSDETQRALNPDQWFDEFCENIIRTKPSIVFFDNLTTSDMYSDEMRVQIVMSFRLKAFCKKMNIPFVYFIHTHTSIKAGHKGIIDMNDVHGSKKIIKLVEFQYILQNFNIGEEKVTTLRPVKHRGKNIETKMFLLPYNKEKFTYKHFIKMSFFEFKKLYNDSNDLTRK